MDLYENVSTLINLIVFKVIVHETRPLLTLFLTGIIMKIHFQDVIDF